MKTKAVIEVVAVFCLTLFITTLVGLSPVGEWERQVLHHVYIEYAVMIGLPLLILVVSHRNLASYGLSLRNLRYHLGITANAIIPVILASVPLAFIDNTQWSGALSMKSGGQITLLNRIICVSTWVSFAESSKPT